MPPGIQRVGRAKALNPNGLQQILDLVFRIAEKKAFRLINAPETGGHAPLFFKKLFARNIAFARMIVAHPAEMKGKDRGFTQELGWQSLPNVGRDRDNHVRAGDAHGVKPEIIRSRRFG